MKSGDRRERRAFARFAALPFERIQQRGLFAADIRARAGMHENVEIEPGVENIFPQQPHFPRLLDGFEQAGVRQHVFAANIDVALRRADAIAGNDHPFNQLMRVALDN